MSKREGELVSAERTQSFRDLLGDKVILMLLYYVEKVARRGYGDLTLEIRKGKVYRLQVNLSIDPETWDQSPPIE